MKSLAALVALATLLAVPANAVAVWGQCKYFRPSPKPYHLLVLTVIPDQVEYVHLPLSTDYYGGTSL